MKKLLLPLFLLGTLFAASSASAIEEFNIDVATITCKDLLETDQDSAGAMILWVDGYMSAKSGDTRLSTEWIAKLSANLAAYCVVHPEKTLMDAINSMQR